MTGSAQVCGNTGAARTCSTTHNSQWHIDGSAQVVAVSRQACSTTAEQQWFKLGPTGNMTCSTPVVVVAVIAAAPHGNTMHKLAQQSTQ